MSRRRYRGYCINLLVDSRVEHFLKAEVDVEMSAGLTRRGNKAGGRKWTWFVVISGRRQSMSFVYVEAYSVQHP
jgi:hypothetical protein